MEHVVNYIRLDKLQKIVIAYIASRTPDSELVPYMNQFLELNVGRNGTISKKELKNYIASIKARFPKQHHIFSQLDINQTKEIEYLGT